MSAVARPLPPAAAHASTRASARGIHTSRRKLRLGSALDRYVLLEFLKVFTVTAIGFPVLLFVIDLVDNLNKYLGRRIPRADLLLSYVYWLPEQMFLVLPAAVLFATVFTVGAVTRHSEITAAKASGISFYRFILPIVWGAMIATGLGLALGEVLPDANAVRMQLLRESKDPMGTARANFAYAAEGGRVYQAQLLLVDSGQLVKPQLERKGNGADYPGLLAAAQDARYREGQGWMLRNGALHLMPGDTVVHAFAFDSVLDRRMQERPRDLLSSAKAPADMDFRELGAFITAMERSGVDVGKLRVERMLKIAIPVTCVIILLFGAPLATSTQRGGTAYGVGLSLGTTVIFLVLIQLTRAIGGKGLIQPELAAWIPSALFGIVGGILLARVRT
ncbi:MAG: LptF/LptG family permease [Gemmatirosa sp.]